MARTFQVVNTQASDADRIREFAGAEGIPMWLVVKEALDLYEKENGYHDET